MKKICVCICGLNRSLNLVIQNFNKIFSEFNINYIIVTSNSIETEYINHINQDVKNINIIKHLILKDYDYSDFRNSENYSNKLAHAISLIEVKYDLYILCRSDFIINFINLKSIYNDKIYFSKNHINSYTKNKDKINDNIIITKNYNQLLKLINLHNFNQVNKNFLDINLYNYLIENSIDYEIIDIQYKLLLSECNIIAISGDSGSGKTSLSKILELLFEKEVCILETDRYHKWERGNKNYKKYTHLNPYANHLERMSEDVFQYKIGEDVYQVDYNHKNGKFTQKQKIKNKNNLVLCGLHTLYQPNMNKLLNLKIYLDTDRELINKWKIERDVKERGYSLEKVLKQIEGRQKDYNKYIIQQKANSDIIIQFYEKDKKLECNFIIQNENISNIIITKIINKSYSLKYDKKNLIIKLMNNIDIIGNKEILKLVNNNKDLFKNNFYIEILNMIYTIIRHSNYTKPK